MLVTLMLNAMNSHLKKKTPIVKVRYSKELKNSQLSNQSVYKVLMVSKLVPLWPEQSMGRKLIWFKVFSKEMDIQLPQAQWSKTNFNICSIKKYGILTNHLTRLQAEKKCIPMIETKETPLTLQWWEIQWKSGPKNIFKVKISNRDKKKWLFWLTLYLKNLIRT